MMQIVAIIGAITGFIGGFGMLFAKGPPENRSRMRRQAIISFVAGTICVILLATRLL